MIINLKIPLSIGISLTILKNSKKIKTKKKKENT